MKRNFLWAAIVASLAIGVGVTAAQKESKPARSSAEQAPSQTTPPLAPKPAAKPSDEGEIVLTSERGKHDDVTGVSQLNGNVVVRQEGEDFVLHADSVTYNRNLKQAVATGNLRVETHDSTITGLNLRANFDTKHIVIAGKVVMNSHGKDTGMKKDEDAKKPVAKKAPGDAIGEIVHKPSKMTCDKIDFNYDIREALVTGNIHVVQGETSGTCRQITFDEENNVAELKGDVLFTDKDGQTFATEVLTIWFDADRLEFQGPFTLKGKKKKEESASEPGAKPAPRQPKRDFGKPPPVPDLDREAPEEKTPEKAAEKPGEKPAG